MQFNKLFSIEYKISPNRRHKIYKIFGIKLSVKLKGYEYKTYEKFNLSESLKRRNLKQKNKNAKILVCLHLYYEESFEAIKRYLNNLKGYDYDLIISLTEGRYQDKLIEKIKSYKRNTKIYIFKNLGYDVLPFINVIKTVNLDNYDVVFKLHSKGITRNEIFIYGQLFKYNDWFLNLFNGILSPNTVHIAIDKLYNNKKIGLAAAKNLIINDPKHKKFFTLKIAEKLGIKLDENYRYVAGTCFAIKANLLKDIQKLNFKEQDFEAQETGFSMAHALERIVCAAIEKSGYEFFGTDTPHPNYQKEKYDYEKYSALKILEDERIKIDYDFFYKRLEGRKIKNYEPVRIRLGDIRRIWFGELLTLKECHAYMYLKGEKRQYDVYCKVNRKNSNFYMSKERFNTLIDSMEKGFFKELVLPIINQDNIILDGQHRMCILLNKFGEDYMVKCLKIEFA